MSGRSWAEEGIVEVVGAVFTDVGQHVRIFQLAH